MLGRALFTLVGLVIAAGLVLPFYPQTGQTPSAASAPEAMALLAAPDGFGCQDCPIEGGDPGTCRPECACGERLAATFVLVADQPVRLTLTVMVRVLPAEPSPPSKLPAI
jgi:hypothetical protein